MLLRAAALGGGNSLSFVFATDGRILSGGDSNLSKNLPFIYTLHQGLAEPDLKSRSHALARGIRH